MDTWKVEKPSRLLLEIKGKFSNGFVGQDLKWSIEHNRCFINNVIERFCSASVEKGDIVDFYPEKMPLFIKENKRIIFEDPHIFVYNKPPYLTSEKLAQITGTYLAHRLDRDTSGVILLAKNQKTLLSLEQQFLKRKVHKEYLTLVEGCTELKGKITGKMSPIQKREGATVWGMQKNGLWSHTDWICLKHFENSSLLKCIPLTGRTHQIRVHLKHIGHAIKGDYTYGYKKKEGIFRPLLHAQHLCITHPISQKKCIYSAPLPLDFCIPS